MFASEILKKASPKNARGERAHLEFTEPYKVYKTNTILVSVAKISKIAALIYCTFTPNDSFHIP